MARLGGVSEVAEALGVSRQRIAQLRARPDFPDPLAEIAQGPIWDLEAVAQWLGSGARRSAGRPSAVAQRRVVGERFELEEPPIASGGFGDVFRAIDRKTGRPVAVKILKNITNVDDEAVRRFKRELRLMSERLDHPYVMRLIDHGDCAEVDSIWCAMPLAVGSLADEVSGFKGDHMAVVDLARQLCAGLSYVHDAGVLHRDLKPGNVLRTDEGVWAISDFGLAREFERQTEALTSTLAQGLGTIVYASPEQWAKPKSAEIRDDIYSLGKILQHALTGELPMVPAAQIPESPLRHVIERVTGPRENRYASALDFLSAIEQAVDLYDPTWEAPEDRAARLRPRVVSSQLDPLALEELLAWLQQNDIEEETGSRTAACQLFVACSREGLSHLWTTDRAGFRRAFSVFCRWVEASNFEFTYCDDIADAAARAVQVTGDDEVLRSAITGLVSLGSGHNRWHVRDVITKILQGIRDHDRAIAALEGLQEATAWEVRWAVTDFALRSLHPVLRQGVAEMFKMQDVAS